jgi:hypothetical protein
MGRQTSITRLSIWVLLCPLSALGFYFFWRWGYVIAGSHPGKQSAPKPCRRLPSFFQPSDYYNLHAFINYSEREWAYEEQEWVDRLFVGAGIQSSKKTPTSPARDSYASSTSSGRSSSRIPSTSAGSPSTI